MDNILELFKYFAQFVPTNVLEESFVQPEHSSSAGYEEISREILNFQSQKIIPDIAKYVFSADADFVFDKLRNADELFLFVEYGSAELADISVTQQLAINIATDISSKNTDNLNEVLLMNRCKNILMYILEQMKIDINQNCFACGEIEGTIELMPIEPSKIRSWKGWCAFIYLNIGFEKIIL